MGKVNYYHTEHFKNTYRDKWVVLCEPAPNYTNPFFVHKDSTSKFYYTTSLVNKAVIFDSKEQAERYIKAANLYGVLPFCLNNIGQLVAPK
jgi:hypothetical protein